MDVRALLEYWAMSHSALAIGDYNTATMGQSVYYGDTSYNTGRSVRRWGHDYTPLELWLAIDRLIFDNFDEYDLETIQIYVEAMCGSYGFDWKRWKALPEYITDRLEEVIEQLTEELKGEVVQ